MWFFVVFIIRFGTNVWSDNEEVKLTRVIVPVRMCVCICVHTRKAIMCAREASAAAIRLRAVVAYKLTLLKQSNPFDAKSPTDT